MPGSAGAIRAGAAYVEAYLNDNKLRRGLDQLSKRLRSWGSSLAIVGGSLFAGASAAAAPLFAAVDKFVERGARVSLVAERIGITAEALSELQFAARQAGADIDVLDEGLTEMKLRLGEAAQTGSGAAFDALKVLGLDAEKLNRLKPEEAFGRIADAINSMPDARNFNVEELFGGDGRALTNLIQRGSRGIDELRAKAREFGQSISGEDASAAAKLATAWKDVKAAFSGAVLHVGAALADELTKIATAAARIALTVADWIDANRGLVVTIAKIIALVAAAGIIVGVLGAGLIFAGAAAAGVSALFGLAASVVAALGSGLAFLVSPIGLVIAALVALAGWFFTSTEAGGEALDWLMGKFAELKDFTLGVFGGIADALAAGNIALAARILWLALQVVWQKGVGALMTIWAKLKGFLLASWNTVVFGLAGMMTEAWAAIQVAWVEGTHFLADLWDATINAMIQLWTTLQNAVGGFFIDVLANVGVLSADEAKAAKELLAQDTGGRAAQSQTKTDAAILAREEERKRERAEIEAQRKGARDALAQQQNAELNEIDQAQRAAVAAADAKLQAAREALAEAEAEAHKQAGEAALAPKGERKPPSLSGADVAARGTIQSAGSFSALAAVRQFGATTTAERAAKAAEETADNTKKIAKAAKRGLAFS